MPISTCASRSIRNGTIYSAEFAEHGHGVHGQYAGKVFNTNAGRHPNFASPAFGGRSLNSLLLDGTINPGQMSIVREILTDTTNVTGGHDTDTAIFQGTRAEYDIEGITVQRQPQRRCPRHHHLCRCGQRLERRRLHLRP